MTDQNQLQQTILDELGLSDLPEDKKNELLTKMTEVILKRIFVETMDKLSEADQQQYEQMIEQNVSPEELEGFLREKISDYDTMIQRIVEGFKEDMKKEI